jgi:hypothetical protein
MWLQIKWKYHKINVKKLIRRLLTKDFCVIGDFVNYLRDVMCRKASTLLSTVNDIKRYLKWYVIYNNSHKRFLGNSSDLIAILDVITNLNRECRKERRADQSSNKDIVSLQESNLWPIGGMQELYEAVKSEIDWVDKIDSLTVITKPMYVQFTRAMAASAYLSPQGRVHAVTTMLVGKYRELRDRGFYLSNDFKTQSQFGYQPVTAGYLFLLFLEKYVKYVRPKMLEKDTDFLFIDIDGSTMDMGRRLTAYFEHKMQLHITTNTIRSLVETEADSLLRQGLLSPVAREAVMNVNGHSSRITTDFYVRRDREKDVKNAFQAFKSMNANYLPIPNPNIEEKDFEIQSDIDDQSPVMLNFSTQQNFSPSMQMQTNLQPDLSSTETSNVADTLPASPMRIKWKECEINYVGEWCMRTLKANPANTTNIVARCLKHIKETPHVKAMFHTNHILNSTRLKHAFDTYRAQHLID